MTHARLLGATAFLLLFGLTTFACSSSSSDTPADVPALGDAGTGDTSTGGDDTTDAPPGNDSGKDAGLDADDPDTGPPAPLYIGRFDESTPLGPTAAWPGSRAIARFDGTAASVRLTHAPGFSGGPAWFDVVIDGVVGTPFSVTGESQDYVLASGLAPGVHIVEIAKRTEANLGYVRFEPFAFPGGGALLPPPARAKRRIEFLSDSTIDGFGVEGNVATTCAGGAPPQFNDAQKGTAADTATALSAEMILLAYSGKGITKNQDAMDTDVFGILYPRTLPEDDTSTWAFTSNIPDAVVLSLGGTDFDGLNAAPAGFQAAYDALIGTIRTHYPDAHVFCTLWSQIKDYGGALNTRSAMRTTLQAVVNGRKGAGDAKIWYFEFPEADFATDETGCYNHGNAAHHQAMSALLAAEMKTRLGW